MPTIDQAARACETYFNEIDSFAANWLRCLFPDALVDERSIADVQPANLMGQRRCHFFGGIGGWEYALQLAGWPAGREVWTGSCPCQPLSCAGKRAGEVDDRHLWPQFFRLIAECSPATIFGEQVASGDGLEWLDGVSLDLEDIGYAVCAADLPAASQGAPHIRQRFFWAAVRMADCCGERCGAWSGGSNSEGGTRLHGPESSANGQLVGMANADGGSRVESNGHTVERRRQGVAKQAGVGGIANGPASRLADASNLRSAEHEHDRDDEGRAIEQPGGSPAWGYWLAIPCADGRARRISAEPGDEPLAARIPSRKSDPAMGLAISRLVKLGHSPKRAKRILREARANRVGRLRGYGNAIVPQAAAIFIRAVMEATQ